RKQLLDHAFGRDRRKIVTRGPVLRAVLDAPIELVGLERLERDGCVAKINEAYLVEVVGADALRNVLAPIVLHPLVHDRASRLERLDAVGPAAERGFER